MAAKSIDELIQGFFDDSLSPEEYKQLQDNIKNKKYGKQITPEGEKKEEAIKKVPKVVRIVLNESSASMIFENGLCLKLHKDGELKLSHGNETIEVDENFILTVPPSELAKIYWHIVSLHQKDNKLLKSQLDNIDQKNRYVTTGNKRAFIAGMIFGKLQDFDSLPSPI